MMRPSTDTLRNPIILIVAGILALALIVGGIALAMSGSSGSTDDEANGVSLAACDEARDPNVDPSGYVAKASECFTARRTAADGVWLSHNLAAATDSEKVRSWQISQANNGDAAVVEAGQTTDAAVPHLIIGNTDFISADVHPARAWLKDNAPNALWISHPSAAPAWEAGRLNIITEELLPGMSQWSAVTNPDGSGLVTGYLDTATITGDWVAKVGAPVSVSFNRAADGSLVSIMIAGQKTVHIWRVLEFKKTLLPTIPTEGIVESSKIPASAGFVGYDFFDLNAPIFTPPARTQGPKPNATDEPTDAPQPDTSPSGDPNATNQPDTNDDTASARS